MPRVLVLARNSEIQDYKKCRLLWHWTWNLNLKPKQAAPALRFGDLIHRSLELRYKKGRKRGIHPAKTFVKLYREQLETLTQFGVRDQEGDWLNAEELGVDMMEHFVEYYGEDEHIDVIAPEMPFQWHLDNPKTGKYLVTIVGKLDAVYFNHTTGRIGILDWKTASTIETDHLYLDEQPATYHAIAPLVLVRKGLMDPGQEIDHILFSIMRKGMRDTRPKNAQGQSLNKPKKEALAARVDHLALEVPARPKVEDLVVALKAAGEDPAQLGEPSAVQPAQYFHREPIWRDDYERQQTIKRIIFEAYEMAMVRAGKLPVYKTPGRPPNSHCRYCPMKDPCELEESGADYEEMLRLNYEEWEPYADHEIARKG